MQKDVDGGWVPGSANSTGATRVAFVPPSGPSLNISLIFADIALTPPLVIFDIWQQRVVARPGAADTNYTATVPWQGTAFLRV